ncbi:hypothetical protein BD410DRAFT_846513 [Rickenella mellea]|uniref:Uncharacterized protein n=1 Tax=Rickenella mellea TaxID=50990 RepID=A0A4Y7PF76_9AGAM|nr:hypothetical protein BD410DRAFT_846513 [Rickenella mellea]
MHSIGPHRYLGSVNLNAGLSTQALSIATIVAYAQRSFTTLTWWYLGAVWVPSGCRTAAWHGPWTPFATVALCRFRFALPPPAKYGHSEHTTYPPPSTVLPLPPHAPHGNQGSDIHPTLSTTLSHVVINGTRFYNGAFNHTRHPAISSRTASRFQYTTWIIVTCSKVHTSAHCLFDQAFGCALPRLLARSRHITGAFAGLKTTADSGDSMEDMGKRHAAG